MSLWPVDFLYRLIQEMNERFGDLVYQQRVWVEHNGPEMDDYDESYMYLIDTCEKVLKCPDYYEGVDDIIFGLLKGWHDRVEEFDDKVGSKIEDEKVNELIATPEWKEIQKLTIQTVEYIKRRLEEKGYVDDGAI